MLGKDTNYFVGLSINQDRCADRAGIAAKSARPHAVGKDGGGGMAGKIFVGREQAAQSGMHAEHRKKIRRDADGADSFGVTLSSQVIVPADCDREVVEAVVARLDIEILGGRKPVLRNTEAWGTIPEDDQAVGIGVGKRAEQQGVCNAEYGGIRSDTDGER